MRDIVWRLELGLVGQKGLGLGFWYQVLQVINTAYNDPINTSQ